MHFAITADVIALVVPASAVAIVADTVAVSVGGEGREASPPPSVIHTGAPPAYSTAEACLTTQPAGRVSLRWVLMQLRSPLLLWASPASAGSWTGWFNECCLPSRRPARPLPCTPVNHRYLAYVNNRKEPDRGRYLEELLFQVGNASCSSGEAAYAYKIGLRSPKATTFAASLNCTMTTTLIATTPDVLVRPQPQQVAEGVVCVDDKTTGFKCAKHHLPAQTKDDVPISVHVG